MEQIKLSSYVKSVLAEEDLPRFDADDKGGDKGEEKKEMDTILTIECHDGDGTLKKIIDHIKEVGASGRDFKVVVDPDNKETTKEFAWDGKGASGKIESVKAEKVEEKKDEGKEGKKPGESEEY